VDFLIVPEEKEFYGEKKGGRYSQKGGQIVNNFLITLTLKTVDCRWRIVFKSVTQWDDMGQRVCE